MSYVAHPRVSSSWPALHTYTYSIPSAGRDGRNGQAFWNQFHALGHDKQPTTEWHPWRELMALDIRAMHYSLKRNAWLKMLSPHLHFLHILLHLEQIHRSSRCTFVGMDKTCTFPLPRQHIASHQLRACGDPRQKALGPLPQPGVQECYTSDGARSLDANPSPLLTVCVTLNK